MTFFSHFTHKQPTPNTEAMATSLKAELQEILYEDSLRSTPVIQSISLFFWQQLATWAQILSQQQRPFIVALGGASGSGKSFVRDTLVTHLTKLTESSAFTQDSYYRDFEADFPHLALDAFYDEIDLDDPVHIRFDRLAQDLHALQALPLGHTLTIPRLRYGTPTQKPTIIEQGQRIDAHPVVITEGIFAFYDPAITTLCDLKIFVNTDEKTRKARWYSRNETENRGVTANMWQTTIECLQTHIQPSQEVADVILNNAVPQAAMARFIEQLVSRLAGIIQTHTEEAQLNNTPDIA